MTPPLVTAGFHHITMVARDARRTLFFYSDVLGISLVKKTVNFDDPGAYHLYFGSSGGAPGTILTFFEWPRAERGGWGLGAVHHLALGTSTADALLKWKRRLEDAGVSVSGPFDRKWFRSIYFTDPDGQILEIATAGPGYALDEPIEALGSGVIIPAPEHLRGSRDDDAIQALRWPEPVPAITPDMTLQGIHHVSAITDDVQRADEFYHAALGLRIVKKTINQDFPTSPHWFWASYDGRTVAPHSALTLFGFPDMRRHGKPGAGQTHHIAFRAENADQQLAWREHLLEMKVDVSPVLDRTYFTSIYFRAPDGLLLEIATDGPGFAIDEPADLLGSAVKLPAWLEGQREEIVAGLPAL